MNIAIRQIIPLPLLLFSICASILTVGAVASDSSQLETALQSKYVGKVFTLRGFYEDDHLHFDGTGNAIGKVHPGSWTTSIIAIENAKVSADKVELRGSRVAEVYDTKRSKFAPVRTQAKTLFAIDRDVTQPDAAVLTAIEHLFLSADDRLVDLVPDYWKAVLSGGLETVPQQHGPDCHRIKGRLERRVNGDISMGCEEHARVKTPVPPQTGINGSLLPYEVEKGVTPPRAIFRPDPTYNDVARSAEFQATFVLQLTVMSDGSASDLAIIQPVGLGLDDRAVAAVKTRKFKPSMLGGQPVPVRISVEVNFHMR
jgi:TonB family protein